jgi:DNA-binding PadR family transcriptional regulator
LGKHEPDLPQGTLDMLILKALSLDQMHGYGIGQRIRQLAEEMLTVEEGTLYPALYRIEQRGWIWSEWGPQRTTGGRASIRLHGWVVNSSPLKRRSGVTRLRPSLK